MVAVSNSLSFDTILGIDVDNILALLGDHHKWTPNSPIPEDLPNNLDQEDGEQQEPLPTPSPSSSRSNSPVPSPTPPLSTDGRSPSRSPSRHSDVTQDSCSSSSSKAEGNRKSRKPRTRPRRKCTKGQSYVKMQSSSSSSDGDDLPSAASGDSGTESRTRKKSGRIPKCHPTLSKNNPLNRSGPKIPLEGGRAQLLAAQANDPSLASCREQAHKDKDGLFSFVDELLVRKWNPPSRRRRSRASGASPAVQGDHSEDGPLRSLRQPLRQTEDHTSNHAKFLLAWNASRCGRDV